MVLIVRFMQPAYSALRCAFTALFFILNARFRARTPNPPLISLLPSSVYAACGSSPIHKIGEKRRDTEGHRNGDNIVWPPPTALPPPAPPTEAATAASHAPADAPSDGRGLQRKGPNLVLRGVSGAGAGAGVRDSSVEMAS